MAYRNSSDCKNDEWEARSAPEQQYFARISLNVNTGQCI